MEMRDLIADIDWEVTGSELIALLKESSEIKQISLFITEHSEGQDFNGAFSALPIKTAILISVTGSLITPTISPFGFYSQGKSQIKAYYHSLKNMTCVRNSQGFMKPTDHVFIIMSVFAKEHAAEKNHRIRYNERAGKAAEEFMFTRRNFFIIDKGRDEEERCAVKL